MGGDRDQPEQRQADPDHDAGQHAEDQRAQDGCDRDPEVEPLDAVEPAHLGDVHHAHHDGLDDQRAEHRLGQLGEQRRQDEQRQQHGDTGGDRGQPGPRAGVVVERAGRQAGRDRHALRTPPPRCWRRPGRPTPGRCRSGSGAWRRTPARRRRSGRTRSARARPPRPPLCRRGPTSAPGREARTTAGRGARRRRARPRARRGPAARRRAARRRPGRARPALAARRVAARRRRRARPHRRPPSPLSVSPSAPSQDRQLLERVRAGDVGAGELGKLADDDVDRRAEEEAGDHRTGQELGDPAHPEHRQDQEEHARREGDARRRTTRRPARR